MLAERGVNVDRDFAGFSVMRLKWKNGCAGTSITADLYPWHMKTVRSMAAGRICTGAVDSRGRTVDFISPPS